MVDNNYGQLLKLSTYKYTQKDEFNNSKNNKKILIDDKEELKKEKVEPVDGSQETSQQVDQTEDTNLDNSATMDDPNTVGDPDNPNAMSDPNDPNSTDPSMMGMPGGDIDPMTGQPIKTDEELGKTYELKKIYSRLISLSNFIDTTSDRKVVKLKKYIYQATELFQTVMNNFKSYKDKIDDIIILFYKFIYKIYSILNKYYAKKHKENK